MSRNVLLAGLACLMLPWATAPGAQQASAPSAAVSGVVIDGSTGAPIPGAVVYLGREGRGVVAADGRQSTDGQGRFVFADLAPADDYSLSVSRPGYLDGGYSRAQRFGTTDRLIALAEGQWVDNVRIALWHLGSISGVVADEAGEPVVGVFVTLVARLRIAGHDRLVGGPVTTTDDRGVYRFGNVLPARYLVAVPVVQHSRRPSAPAAAPRPGMSPEMAIDAGPDATIVTGPYPMPPPPRDGQSLAYPITFHPGATSAAEAAVIDLDYGESRDGVDIQIAPQPSTFVSGLVQGPPDAVTGLLLRLVPRGLEGVDQNELIAGTALADPDGRFTFANVPTGAYTIEASSSSMHYVYEDASVIGGPGSRVPGIDGRVTWTQSVATAPVGTRFRYSRINDATPLTGGASVVVSTTPIADVVIPLGRSTTVTGRFVLEMRPGEPRPDRPGGLVLIAEPADGDPALGTPRATASRDDPDLPFTMDGLRPGRYLLQMQGTWRLKSVLIDGRDYARAVLDTTASGDIDDVVVTATSAEAVIEGHVRSGVGPPPPDARVVAFPVDRAQWPSPGLTAPDFPETWPGPDGTYRIDGLRAGEYHVAVLPQDAPLVWRDPTYLDRLSVVASRVSVDWNGTRTIDLQGN